MIDTKKLQTIDSQNFSERLVEVQVLNLNIIKNPKVERFLKITKRLVNGLVIDWKKTGLKWINKRIRLQYRSRRGLSLFSNRF